MAINLYAQHTHIDFVAYCLCQMIKPQSYQLIKRVFITACQHT